MLDDNVRNSWQIDARAVTLAPEWHATVIAPILAMIVERMSISVAARVEAHLYKLLIYETGGHFAAHKDTEKETGHFGSLLVTLPSVFEGGVLTCTHAGKTTSFDFAAHARRQPCFAAFFNDVEHCLLPVTSGVRVVLAYNLVRADGGLLPRPYEARHVDTALDRALALWGASHRGPKRLMLKLSHEYSHDGLAWEQLKGDDERLGALVTAAVQRGTCGAALCILDLHDDGDTHGEEYDRYDRYRERALVSFAQYEVCDKEYALTSTVVHPDVPTSIFASDIGLVLDEDFDPDEPAAPDVATDQMLFIDDNEIEWEEE